MRIIRVTEQSFWEGIQYARAGNHVHDISRGVQTYAEGQGYSLVKDYTGHGIGHSVHEDPEVPNYVPKSGSNPRLRPGMALCVEPMLYAGPGTHNKWMPDGWAIPVTVGGNLSAHYENTILITEGEPEILTSIGE